MNCRIWYSKYGNFASKAVVHIVTHLTRLNAFCSLLFIFTVSSILISIVTTSATCKFSTLLTHSHFLLHFHNLEEEFTKLVTSSSVLSFSLWVLSSLHNYIKTLWLYIMQTFLYNLVNVRAIFLFFTSVIITKSFMVTFFTENRLIFLTFSLLLTPELY